MRPCLFFAVAALLSVTLTAHADPITYYVTGGTLEEVIEEAHLDSDHVLAAIERFVSERPKRLAALRGAIDAASQR